MYKQQYRLKLKAIRQIERESALAVVTVHSDAAVTVPENVLDEPTYDLEQSTHSEGKQTGVELEGEDLEEAEIEFEDVDKAGASVAEPCSATEIADVFADSADFDTEINTDKESDSEFDEEETLSQFLVGWNARHNVTCEAIKDLLCGLRAHNHPELPLDPRTLLKTNVAYTVEENCEAVMCTSHSQSHCSLLYQRCTVFRLTI